jgi:hypothetical protein
MANQHSTIQGEHTSNDTPKALTTSLTIAITALAITASTATAEEKPKCYLNQESHSKA